MAQLNTKIALRSDTTANWNAVKDTVVLLKGEVGIEFLTDSTPKMKIGDGQSTWGELDYIGGAQTNVLEVIPVLKDDGKLETVSEALTRASTGKTFNVGDVAYVKETIYKDTSDETKSKYSYTAYVWNGNAWAAMDGNYSADNIYFNDDMMVTTNIGYITTSNGSGTIPSAGKNLVQVFEEMFVQEMEPDNNTALSVSFSSVTSGAKEVGTEITPSYTASFSAGSYEYGPDTGVQLKATDTSATGWTVVAKNGSTLVDTKYVHQDSFDAITVGDSTNYTITATANHTAGVTPNTNKGVPSTTVAAFTAGTKAKTSAAITGYRSYFYGKLTTSTAEEPLTSSIIRSKLTNGGNYNATKSFTLTGEAVDGKAVKRMLIAIPHSSTRSRVKSVILTSAMNTPITDQYTLVANAVKVEGVNNYTAVDYDVYLYEPSKLDAGEVHAITLG